MITEAALVSFAASMFSMMNPIGAVGIFAGMTDGMPGKETRRIAWTCALAVAITLVIVTWAGSEIMRFFGVSVDSLRAAGGVVVLLIGLHMLFNKSEHKHSASELADAKDAASIAVVPLAIPIVAGPGTMATVLVFVHQSDSIEMRAAMSGVIVGISAVTGVLFSFAGPVSRRLGASGIGVVTRVMGLILSAMAMGMLADGLKGMLPGLSG